MGYIRNPWVMMFVVMVMFGLVDSAIMTSQTTLIQERIEYKKQGRVFSADEFLRSLALLIGLTIVTVLTNYFRSSNILYFCGGIQILIAILGLVIIVVKKLNTTDYKKAMNGTLIPFKPSVENK
jgi:MFS family permease